MEQTAKGATFLKVTGILMIIGGAIALILGFVAVAAVAALAYLSDGAISSGLLYAASILTLISAVAELVAGIVGVVNSKKPEKAGACIVWGVIVAVLSVAGCILTAVGGSSFPVVNLILGLVLPALYVIGALKNMNA